MTDLAADGPRLGAADGGVSARSERPVSSVHDRTVDIPTGSDRFGVVLGSGGIFALVFHLGVLEGLAASGVVDPAGASRIVGTSAGASVAAALTQGIAAEEFLAALSKFAPSGFPQTVLQSFRSRPDRSGSNQGFWTSAGQSRTRLLRTFAAAVPGIFPGTGFDALPTGASTEWDDRLWMPAVRVRDGATVVFGRDVKNVSIKDAIQASSAVPFLFEPKRIGPDRFIDGAVNSPTHAGLLAEDGHRFVVVSAPSCRPSNRKARTNYRCMVRGEAGALQRGGSRVLLIAPSAEVVATAKGYPMIDRDAGRRIVAAVRRQTISLLRVFREA